MKALLIAICLSLLASCATTQPFPTEGCIRHRDQYGGIEWVTVWGENPGNVWQYVVTYPYSSVPNTPYYVEKEKVSFNCPWQPGPKTSPRPGQWPDMGGLRDGASAVKD